MVPSTADVIRLRYRLKAWIRLGGAVCLLSSIGPLFQWWLEGLMEDDIRGIFSYHFDRITAAMALAVLGLVGLFLVAGPLARLITPLPPPSPRCPRCGFMLVNISTAHCSECGLHLGEELMTASRQHDPAHPPRPPQQASRPASNPPPPSTSSDDLSI
jgi:hypothetical protein